MRLQLAEESHDAPPGIRVEAQQVDEVAHRVAAGRAMSKELLCDRVAVGLIVDEEPPEALARFRF
jgi:hypothetical protein